MEILLSPNLACSMVDIASEFLLDMGRVMLGILLSQITMILCGSTHSSMESQSKPRMVSSILPKIQGLRSILGEGMQCSKMEECRYNREQRRKMEEQITLVPHDNNMTTIPPPQSYKTGGGCFVVDDMCFY